jgi:hypothetical protein
MLQFKEDHLGVASASGAAVRPDRSARVAEVLLDLLVAQLQLQAQVEVRAGSLVAPRSTPTS